MLRSLVCTRLWFVLLMLSISQYHGAQEKFHEIDHDDIVQLLCHISLSYNFFKEFLITR